MKPWVSCFGQIFPTKLDSEWTVPVLIQQVALFQSQAYVLEINPSKHVLYIDTLIIFVSIVLHQNACFGWFNKHGKNWL